MTTFSCPACDHHSKHRIRLSALVRLQIHWINKHDRMHMRPHWVLREEGNSIPLRLVVDILLLPAGFCLYVLVTFYAVWLELTT